MNISGNVIPPIKITAVDDKGKMQYVGGKMQAVMVNMTRETIVVPLYIGVTGALI